MMKIISLLILLMVSYTKAQIKPNEFSQALFIDGLPDKLNKFSWEEAFFSEIESGAFYKNIYLLFKNQNSFPLDAMLVTVKNDGRFSTQTIRFEKKDETQYQAKFIFRTEQEDKLTPLVMKIDTIEKLLLYQWSGSKNNIPLIEKEYSLKPGNKFPNLHIQTENGVKHIKDFEGKIIVINWWATSCVPCIQEIPELNNLVEKYNDKDIIFISILFDKENLGKFKEKYYFNYLYGFSNKEIFNTLGGAFPRNIIIDKNGIIIFNMLGGSKNIGDELDKTIQSLL